jgi:opacity protein-like surface antigen
MRSRYLSTVANSVLFAVLAAGCARSANAADLPPKAMPAQQPIEAWSWAGLYFGAHIGSAMGVNTVNDPFGPSIFGDQIHSPGYFGGGQIGFNWQAPGSNWVWGIETDASLANLDGTNTCFAFSGTFASLNCRAHTDSFGTATGRVGWAFGPFGQTLVYAKGGLAWAHSDVDMIVNQSFDLIFPGRVVAVSGDANSTAFTSLGWTIGAGAEYAVTPHWTIKAEYDFMDLGNDGVAPPPNSIALTPPKFNTGHVVALPGTTVSQQIHAFKLGLNYKLGPDTAPFPSGAWFGLPVFPAGPAMPVKAAPAAVIASGWDIEGGARYWYSSGRFQKDIAPAVVGPQNPTLNVSRITWDNLTSNAGEGFARVDTPWNVFVKGFAGGGSINGGKVNDEDWGLVGGPLSAAVNTAYSNTLGNASGTLSYWTIDGGYDLIRGPGMKLGLFVGYNEYRDDKSSSSCTQIASPASGICNPPVNTFILGENDKWQSVRVGANAEVMMTDRLKLTGDVAFVPYTQFTGSDFHPQRIPPFVADETGTGIGTQAELFLNYYLTPQFSVGAGGRFWAMWTTSGTDCREPPAGQCPTPLQNQQAKTERYGLLLQAAYKFLP